MISSAGVGSGLDVENIVTQLMELEQRPLLNINTQQLGLQAEISEIGQLKGAMSALQSAMAKFGDADVFRSFNAFTSDTDVLSATTDSAAAPGVHSVSVSQLAQAHRLGSVAFADAAETEVGTGTLTIAVGEDSFSMQITGDNNTLDGIRDTVNASLTNAGVTASILNVDGGSRLVLTARDTGTANALKVTVSNDGDGNDIDATDGLSRLVFDPDATPTAISNMSELDPAKDALFKVDTFDVTRSSNTVDDVIEGVSFTLKAEGDADITVSESTSEALAAGQEIATAYNTLRSTLAGLRNGGLAGDSLLRSVESALSNTFAERSDDVTASLRSAFEAGFSIDKEGVMTFRGGDLLSAMSEDLDSVTGFFSDPDTGFASRFDTLLGSFVDSGGVLDQRIENLELADERLELRATRVQAQLDRTEQRIRAEFGALDILVANLEVTNNFLLQQLDSLPFSTLGRDR